MLFLLILSCGIISLIALKRKDVLLPHSVISCGISILCFFVVSCIDTTIRTADTEICSGSVKYVSHKEEWDQWIPPRTTCSGSGKNRTCSTRAGYWVHHYAKNHVFTTDGGGVSVNQSLDGKTKFTDRFPNTTSELAKFYPKGVSSVSKHRYKNKLKVSNSLYKFDGNVKDYILPEYPDKIYSKIKVNRVIGDFGTQKNVINDELMNINTRLNDVNKKQVNLILVKFDNVDIKHLQALREKWKNGKKNDYIVALSMKNNKVIEVLPISWTESEILNIKIQEIKGKEISNWINYLHETEQLVNQYYIRKEMKDYNYIMIEPSKTGVIVYCTLNIIIFICLFNLRRIIEFIEEMEWNY